MSRNSLRQTVHIHTHRAFVHQEAKLVAALLRVTSVTAGLAESNGNLPPGLWLTPFAGWLPRTGISSATLRSVIEYRLPFTFYCRNCLIDGLVLCYVISFMFFWVIISVTHGLIIQFAHVFTFMLLTVILIIISFPSPTHSFIPGLKLPFLQIFPTAALSFSSSGLTTLCLKKTRQIYQWVYKWKNFENRLTFGEVMGKSLVSCFFWDTVYMDFPRLLLSLLSISVFTF